MIWRRVIRGLRRIEYYSASRPRTIWAKLDDAALIACLVLALVATWLTHRLIEQPVEPRRMSLVASQAGGGGVVVNEADSDVSPGAFLASIELRQPLSQSGWPAATAVHHTPAEQHIRYADRPFVDDLDDLPTDDPVRQAMTGIITKDDPRWLIAPGDGDATTMRPVGWVLNIGVWCIILLPTALLMLRAVRVGMFTVLYIDDRRRIKRSKENRCPTCGYPLHGLEFSERCPECGELAE